MANETITRIEQMLRDATLPQEERDTLLELMANLRQELATLSGEGAEKAASVASFTEVAAREAVRREKDPALLEHATAGMTKAVQSVGSGATGLTRVVNQICDFLSSMGI